MVRAKLQNVNKLYYQKNLNLQPSNGNSISLLFIRNALTNMRVGDRDI